MIIKGKIVNDEVQQCLADFEFDIKSIENHFQLAKTDYDSLSELVYKLMENKELNGQLKQFVKIIPLVFDLVPVIVYTEIGSLDLNPLYKVYYEEDEGSVDEAKALLDENDADIISDYFSENIYSVESLLES